jgi:hypothetical protein
MVSNTGNSSLTGTLNGFATHKSLTFLPQKDFITERWLNSISDFTNTMFNYVRRKERTFYFEKKVGEKKHTKYFSIIN